MDALSSVGGPATAATQTNAFGALDSQEFMRIIFTELGNQDPLAPTDSKALLDQLASLRSIQSDVDLQARLKSLVSDNEFSSASALIGKKIAAGSAAGVVRSATRTDQGVFLNLDSGGRVPLSRVDTILAPAGAGGGT